MPKFSAIRLPPRKVAEQTTDSLFQAITSVRGQAQDAVAKLETGQCNSSLLASIFNSLKEVRFVHATALTQAMASNPKSETQSAIIDQAIDRLEGISTANELAVQMQEMISAGEAFNAALIAELGTDIETITLSGAGTADERLVPKLYSADALPQTKAALDELLS